MLETELDDSLLIRGDGSALDSYLALLDSFGGIDGNLIVSGVSVLNAQIIILDVEVNVWGDVNILNPLPDDLGHLVTVEIDNWVDNLNL